MKAKPARQSPAGSEPPVLSEHQDGVAILTLNRPDKRNTLSRQMLVSLRDIFDAIRDDPEVRVVILGANGPVFSSGHDINEVLGIDRDGIDSLFSLSTGVMEAIRLSPKPVIAQVLGLATAAGCQLVASCDMVVAASSARFQTPGVHIGLFCSTPMVPLSRAIPPKKALEMLLTGEAISAEEAYRVGLVNHVVPPEELEAATMKLAHKIVPFSTYTVALGKEAFYKQLALGQSAAYEVGKEAMVRNALADDAHEGMSAFLEKRQPHWKHR